MRQHEHRRTPYPLTWEPPLAGVLVVTLAIALGIHVGRALALLAAGQGWHWPEPAALFRSLPAILAGDAAAGLTHPVSTPAGLGWWIAATEVGILTGLTVLAGWLLRRWGPHRLRGVATATECATLLGRGRLWRNRRIIRPDLHPPRHKPEVRRDQPVRRPPRRDERAAHGEV